MDFLRAILIDCIPLDMSEEQAEFRLGEAESLISTYGGIVLVTSLQKKLIPHYRTYIGPGKVEDLITIAQQEDANIIIINNELKAQQTYNVAEMCRKKMPELQVWDRIDLILKIFQKHAETKEAQLEIELASIRHMGPRIFGMGMELSRQGGGIGTSGIGETNTEIMKRHLKEQERKILSKLEECKRTRKLHLDRRKKTGFKSVGIVGYTNAGKSTLLNALSKKGAYVADKLFATLDTRVGKVYLPNVEKEVLVSDTIGFIQDLPHMLIESFKSTFEESLHADALLFVMDGHDPKCEEKFHIVHDVLKEIGAENKPILYVCNKSDRYTRDDKSRLKTILKGKPYVITSATEKIGLEELKNEIGSLLWK